jgi:2-oxoglutarate ferredoxin oxidoreductase subunit alpha
VIILSDEVVGHSREKVVVNSHSYTPVARRVARKGEPPYGGIDADGNAIMPRFGDGHNLLITGSTHDEQGFRKTSDPEVHDKLIRRITSKIQDAKSDLEDYEISGPATAEWGIISFGSTSRTIEELMINKDLKQTLRSMRLKTVWPFPDQAIHEFSKTVDKILVPELNLGQLSREVTRVVRNSIEVLSLNKIGGGRMIEPDEVLSAMVNS